MSKELPEIFKDLESVEKNIYAITKENGTQILRQYLIENLRDDDLFPIIEYPDLDENINAIYLPDYLEPYYDSNNKESSSQQKLIKNAFQDYKENELIHSLHIDDFSAFYEDFETLILNQIESKTSSDIQLAFRDYFLMKQGYLFPTLLFTLECEMVKDLKDNLRKYVETPDLAKWYKENKGKNKKKKNDTIDKDRKKEKDSKKKQREVIFYEVKESHSPFPYIREGSRVDLKRKGKRGFNPFFKEIKQKVSYIAINGEFISYSELLTLEKYINEKDKKKYYRDKMRIIRYNYLQKLTKAINDIYKDALKLTDDIMESLFDMYKDQIEDPTEGGGLFF